VFVRLAGVLHVDAAHLRLAAVDRSVDGDHEVAFLVPRGEAVVGAEDRCHDLMAAGRSAKSAAGADAAEAPGRNAARNARAAGESAGSAGPARESAANAAGKALGGQARLGFRLSFRESQ